MNTLLEVRCGLEVHVQINSLSTKLFCSCSTNYQGKLANENTCPICRGLPGSLPQVNGSAIKKGVILAKALDMDIVDSINFSRKHYDYPDLPKGFQITQSDGVLGRAGFYPIKSKNVFIRQIQLEEDPAKLNYENGNLIVDYNRSGIPLIELVTDPDFTSLHEIKTFLQSYRQLLHILGISDTRQEGAFRVDLNISVGSHLRVEVKNIGSDIEILKAFKYEVERQANIKNNPDQIETRHWNLLERKTVLSREKESNADYRYMIEGNIPLIHIPSDIHEGIILPELPWDLQLRLENTYNLDKHQIFILVNDPFLCNFYESLFRFKIITHRLLNQFFWRDYLKWYNSKVENEHKRAKSINLEDVERLITGLKSKSVTPQEYKRILRKHITKGIEIPTDFTRQSEDSSLDSIMEILQTKFPDIWISSYSNPNQINYLVGQAQKYSQGNVNTKGLIEALKNRT